MAARRDAAQTHSQMLRVIGQLMAASPATFTAAFSDAAAKVLREAGLPATEKALAKVEHGRTAGAEWSRTVESRIENDQTLPLQVRLAPDVIYRAAQVRKYIAENHATNAVFNAGLLFARIAQITEVDAAPYVRAGKRALAGQRKGAAKGKDQADEKARLIAPIWAEVVAANPRARHPELCERVGKLARERHPEMFPKPPSERTITNLRKRIAAAK